MWSYNYTYPNYLAHYGVLGMKWGVRRAKKASEKAAMYKRYADDYKVSDYTTKLSSKEQTKMNTTRSKLLAKSTKYANKAARIEAKNKALAGGSKAYTYAQSESLGKTLLKSSLFTSYGASRGKAALEGILYGTANNLTIGAVSVAEPRLSSKK